MRTLYFDCFSGISGDMTVGALLDLGVPSEHLISNLGKLGISDEYEIKIKKVLKNGIEGTDFDVHLNAHHHEHNHNHSQDHGHNHDHNHGEEHVHTHTHHHGRNLFDIEGLIDKSTLNSNIKKISKDIFKIVAEAEAKVHGKGIYDVHFHEVGAVDSIVDIVGTAICIDYLRVDRVISSPINTGKGFVKCEHGVIPVPAPATLNILKDIPIYCDEREFELTTPTGAAIIRALAVDFRSLPEFKVKAVGYGCGKRNTDIPNVLRVMLGENKGEEYVILEATIDDMNPQIYGFLMDKLFDTGAKDVYYTPVYMKKNRPGIVVTITSPVSKEEEIKKLMFRESTTIGIRRFKIERTELDREFKTVKMDSGEVNFKVSSYKGEVVNTSPEYEDIKKISLELNMPYKEVYNSAMREFNNL